MNKDNKNFSLKVLSSQRNPTVGTKTASFYQPRAINKVGFFITFAYSGRTAWLSGIAYALGTHDPGSNPARAPGNRKLMRMLL
jgi:hypothetical protein